MGFEESRRQPQAIHSSEKAGQGHDCGASDELDPKTKKSILKQAGLKQAGLL